MLTSFGFRTAVVLCLLCVSTARAQTARPTTNTGQAGQTGQAEAVGQITGDERFLRENRAAGQMVGGTTAGVGNLAGQDAQAANINRNVPRGTTNVFGQRGGLNPQQQFGGWNQLQNFARNTGRAGTPRALRVPIELGFTGPVATLGANPERIQSRLDRIPQIREMGEVRVQMEGRVAVLQGQVATPQERDLVARMMLLEPGIGDVRNELEVTGP